MTKTNFKNTPTDGMLEISLREFANEKGRLKVFLNENYRNGFYENREVLIPDTTIERLNVLADITIKNNTDGEELIKKILEEGVNRAKKQITAVDLVNIMRCGPNSHIIKGLKELYKDDEEFLKTIKELQFIFWQAEDYTSEQLEDLLKEHKQKYFIIIGGNTRFFLLRREVIAKDEKGEADGSEETTFFPVFLYNFEQLENNKKITKIKAGHLAGLDYEGQEVYYGLHEVFLTRMILEDNDKEKRNVPFENVLYAKGAIVQIVKNKKMLYDNRPFDVRKIYTAFKPIFDDLGGFETKSRWITWGLSFKILKDTFGKEILKNKNQKNSLTISDLTYCAKLIKETIPNKCDDDENNADRVRELTGINMKEANLDNENTLRKFLNFSIKAHERVRRDATDVAVILRPFLNQKYQNEKSWVLNEKDEVEIIEKAVEKLNNDDQYQKDSKTIKKYMSEPDVLLKYNELLALINQKQKELEA